MKTNQSSLTPQEMAAKMTDLHVQYELQSF